LAVTLPYLRLSLNATSRMVERPTLRGAPDVISASPYRLGSDHVRTPQTEYRNRFRSTIPVELAA
jgi:hypothetical protein